MSIEKLKQYDKLYYNFGTSSLSDLEYDKLKEEMREKYPDHEYFSKVGSSVDGEKVELPFVLGSLDKMKIDTIEKWISEHGDTYILSEKLDGVSILAHYKDGKIIRAFTRGDGFFGKDITNKAHFFCSDIDCLRDVYVRGECMLLNNIYEKLGFKNARNGVTGIINSKSSLINVAKHITPFFYEVVDIDNNDFKNEIDRVNFLSDNFNHTPKTKILSTKNCNVLEEIQKFYNEIKENSDYEVDGVVITTADYVRENVEYPKNKIAYKENRDFYDAKVLDVEWNVTRTGRVTPVVIIEPIDIGGVTVSRATGFNFDFIKNNDIGKDTEIKICRSGDVIPYITEIVKPTKALYPKKCPSCNLNLERSGVDLICVNSVCGLRSYLKLEHFIRTLGAENITSKTLIKLNIDTIERLYIIDEFEIASYDGFGIKRGRQICSEIRKTLNTTPDRLIYAFGLPNVGNTASKAIYNYFINKCENDNHFMQMIFHVHPSELEKIDGIGEVIAQSFFKNIRYSESTYDFLLNEGLTFEKGSKSLNGLTFTLTGNGPIKRPILTKMIEQNGGSVKGISRNVNYLVTSNMKSTSGKMKKAREYSINIINYEELLKMLEN